MRVTLIRHREGQAACPRSQSSKAPVLLRAETQGHLTPSQSGNEVSCPPWCGRVTRDICSRLSSTWHLWSQRPIFLGESPGGLTPCLVPASDPDLANDSPVSLTTVTSSGESRGPHKANQTLEFCRNDSVRGLLSSGMRRPCPSRPYVQEREQAQGPGTTQSQGTRLPQPDRGGMLKMTAQGCPDRGVLEDACSVISATGSGTAPAIPWSQQSK